MGDAVDRLDACLLEMREAARRAVASTSLTVKREQLEKLRDLVERAHDDLLDAVADAAGKEGTEES